MLRDRYPTEDDYFDALAAADAEAEKEAWRSAEFAADLIEFDSEEERDEYIEEYFAGEYYRLCEEYEKAL